MKSEYRSWGLTGLRSRALLLASVALGAVGCSGPVDGDASGEPTATLSEEFRCNPNQGDPLSGDCPWRFPWSRVLPTNGVDITHTWAPAMLSSATGWLIFSVDNTNHYRMLQKRTSGNPASPSWGTYGATRTWKSKPALAHKENSASGLPGFVVAGKLSDNTVVTSSGIMAPSSTTLGLPTADKPFEVVEAGRTYSSGGLPAITNYDQNGVNNLVMVLMGDDGRTIYAHTRPIPYNASTSHWSSRITGPTLPTGWSVVYAPTIAAEYAPNMLAILIHARKGSTDAFFVTHFSNLGYAAHFSNSIGSPALVWTQAPNIGAINDDPTLSWSPATGLTAYYLRGSQIVETGWEPDPSRPVLPVAPSTGINFTSSPSVTEDAYYDQGTHVVIARATNALYLIDSNQDSKLDPWLTE